VTKYNSIAWRFIGLFMGIMVAGCGNDQDELPKNYPDQGTPQATLYVEKCGQCHGAPLPSVHSANIWPSVLDRMQGRMKTNHVSPLTRQEMSIILGYLQQHASKQPVQPPGGEPLQDEKPTSEQLKGGH
jgi:hypothetical protein